jgi:FkbM family methyltransferase
MLIPLEQLNRKYKLDVHSVLHIGAHECEELGDYVRLGVDVEKIYWLEANPELVQKMKHRYIPNVFQAAVSDTVEVVDFIITNNYQSSSILELEEHLKEHPHVFETTRIKLETIRVEQLLDEWSKNTEFKMPNFVNLDIQGAELKALKGFGNYLEQVDYVYSEINTKCLYKNCALLPEMNEFLEQKGFRMVEIKHTQHGWGDAFYMRQSLL